MMQRYFFEIAYDGTGFSGWQNQDNALTIQGKIEGVMSQLFNQPMEILGCGRTDAGVHASQYFFHSDINPDTFSEDELLFKLDNMIGSEIAFNKIIKVHEGAHARFDASARAYRYHIGFAKDPFNRQYVYRLPKGENLDLATLNQAANLLRSYKSFFPFCKTNSDVNNYDCELFQSQWKVDGTGLVYHIEANRFLRGMVRLIVGMCINVSFGKTSLDDIKIALDKQERIPHAWSVPASGLFLDKIKYPYINE